MREPETARADHKARKGDDRSSPHRYKCSQTMDASATAHTAQQVIPSLGHPGREARPFWKNRGFLWPGL